MTVQTAQERSERAAIARSPIEAATREGRMARSRAPNARGDEAHDRVFQAAISVRKIRSGVDPGLRLRRDGACGRHLPARRLDPLPNPPDEERQAGPRLAHSARTGASMVW